MSSSATEGVQGPRSAHLDAAWEVAVVSAFIIVFVALVSVVIFQVRRRRRRQRDLEEASNARPRRRNPSSMNTKIQERDPEKGIDVVDPTEGDIETESEDEDIPEPKRKKSKTKSSHPRTKAKQKLRPKGQKSNSPTSSLSHKSMVAQPSSSDYYFEHPSHKPPKYYWDPQ